MPADWLPISCDSLLETEQTGATMAETDTTLSLAAKIATSYVGNDKVAREQILALISGLHEALDNLESGKMEPRQPQACRAHNLSLGGQIPGIHGGSDRT